MKQLKDFASDINKCSKCGLCQSVCPIFKITGNECAVSKGKFVMLDGVLKGDLKLSKTINKYLEMCLKCDKCSKFCPSGIDVCEIFRTAKAQYLKNTLEGKVVQFLQSELIFDNLINFVDNFNSQKSESIQNKDLKKLLYFTGCANKVFPSSKNSLKKIFLHSNYLLLENPNLKCCGVPFLSSGNLTRYSDVEKYNTDLINQSDCEAVISDCASCVSALNRYPNINKPVINVIDFLSELNLKFTFKKELRVTFHKPCHFDSYDAFLKLINICENIEYVEMPEYDECCGFAGQFALTNRNLSLEISKNKINNALSISPDIILTACPACILGLKQGLFHVKMKHKPKIMNVTEFLALAKRQ
jgi:glycolate oxidase iron-sulfur subunit